MPSTCPSCERSWGDRAVFCGGCGALLDPDVAPGPRSDVAARWWRHRVVVGVAATLVVAGALLAVPSLSIDREAPVDGEIGVPEPDDLQTASSVARVPPEVPAPDVTCHRGDIEVDCVVWSRDLAPPMDAAGEHGAGVVVLEDRILVLDEEGIQAAEVATGTRVWRREYPDDAGERPQHPAGRVDGAVVLAGPGHTTVVGLDDGEERWTTLTGTRGWPATVGDLVVTTDQSPGGEIDLTARSSPDGEVEWEWSSPWPAADVTTLDDDRLLVWSRHAFVVLDASSGEELTHGEGAAGWPLGVWGDLAAVAATPTASRADSTEPPPPVVRGIDLVEGTQRWEHEAEDVQGLTMVGHRLLVPHEASLTAIDLATGEVAWEVHDVGVASVSGAGWRDGSSPDPDVVVVGDAWIQGARAFDLDTGAELWVQEGLGFWHASVEGGRVMTVGEEQVRWLAARTGRELFRVQSPGMSATGTHDGMLILHHHDSGTVTGVDVSSVAS